MSAAGSEKGQSAPRRGVLFIHTASSSNLGADSWVLLQLAHHLDRDDHRVHFAFTPRHDGLPTPTAREVRKIPELDAVSVSLGPELYDTRGWGRLVALVRTLPALVGMWRLWRLVRRERIAIIHTGDRPRDAAVAVVLSRLTGAVSVIHVHQCHSLHWSRLLRWSARLADVLIPVSAYVGESLLAAGHDAGRVVPVWNGIDIEPWGAADGRLVRQELGIGDQEPVVLTVCRLFAEKGVAELVTAIATVRCELADVQLLIVGEDVSPHGSYSKHLHDEVAAHRLEGAVHFLGRRDDIPRLMAAADVFAMPSRGEPFGLVFAEAMAAGRPVIALADGGAVEVVDDGVTGLLSPPGDAESLADNLTVLLRDPERRREMGERGRERVIELFTTARQAELIADVYSVVT